MKILLLGDASNYHRALSAGLARLGHDVTLASDGSGWMKTGRDIDISRPGGGKIGGALYWLRLQSMLKSDFSGFDVVQLAGTHFLNLRPNRIRSFFDEIRKRNGSVFMTAMATDPLYVEALTGDNPPLRYSEWQSPWGRGNQTLRRAWTTPEQIDHANYIYDNVDGVVSALYEYQKVVEYARPDVPLAYGGIPIDIRSLPSPADRSGEGPLKIYLAAHRGREGEKGADVLFHIIRRWASENPKLAMVLEPGNMPYGDFLRFLGTTDIIVDQLYSYTPATSALLGMALGCIAVSGAEDEYRRFEGEYDPLPIINPKPESPAEIIPQIEALALDSTLREDMRRRAGAFVERHNDASVVGQRFVDFWSERLK